jgi:zinc D-Ala-D-Ala carboxypeptidase
MAKWFSDADVFGLQPELVEKLDRAREVAGVPFIITSGFRDEEHNRNLGGAPNSAHLRGLAVDLNVVDSFTRYRVVFGLLAAGFLRVEVSPRHVHADCDSSLPHPVLFLGPDR